MNNQLPIYVNEEISNSGINTTYKNIGTIYPSQEGYFAWWPFNVFASKNEWLITFNNSNLIEQIYIIGSVARNDSDQHLSDELLFIKNNNQIFFDYFTNQYFNEFQDGLLIKQDGLFLDLVFGEYAQLEELSKEYENEEEEAYDYDFKKHFIDGNTLHILDKTTTWDDLIDNTFIISDHYNQLLNDLESFRSLLK
jgi:hypothetical protein